MHVILVESIMSCTVLYCLSPLFFLLPQHNASNPIRINNSSSKNASKKFNQHHPTTIQWALCCCKCPCCAISYCQSSQCSKKENTISCWSWRHCILKGTQAIQSKDTNPHTSSMIDEHLCDDLIDDPKLVLINRYKNVLNEHLNNACMSLIVHFYMIITSSSMVSIDFSILLHDWSLIRIFRYVSPMISIG